MFKKFEKYFKYIIFGPSNDLGNEKYLKYQKTFLIQTFTSLLLLRNFKEFDHKIFCKYE